MASLCDDLLRRHRVEVSSGWILVGAAWRNVGDKVAHPFSAEAFGHEPFFLLFGFLFAIYKLAGVQVDLDRVLAQKLPLVPPPPRLFRNYGHHLDFRPALLVVSRDFREDFLVAHLAAGLVDQVGRPRLLLVQL